MFPFCNYSYKIYHKVFLTSKTCGVVISRATALLSAVSLNVFSDFSISQINLINSHTYRFRVPSGVICCASWKSCTLMCCFLWNSLHSVGLGKLGSQIVRLKDPLEFQLNTVICVHCHFMVYRTVRLRARESVILTDRENNTGGFFAVATYNRQFVIKNYLK